jgi:N-acetyl-alpha-D-muramate 1-phosphate uridylyltransferase
MSERDELPTICILAGGHGERLGTLVADIPKPLLEVAGEPFLLHQLRLLAAHEARNVVLCVGYLGERIEERIGNEQFGIQITYSYDSPMLDGTLGAIRRALPLLPDRFLVLYGDTYLRLDYGAAAEAWWASGLLGLMTAFRNDGRWDASNAEYESGRVVAYDKALPRPEMRWIDYGLGGLDVSALTFVDEAESDLATLYRRLAEEGELCGYEVADRFYEIGTAEALSETEHFLRSTRP